MYKLPRSARHKTRSSVAICDRSTVPATNSTSTGPGASMPRTPAPCCVNSGASSCTSSSILTRTADDASAGCVSACWKNASVS